MGQTLNLLVLSVFIVTTRVIGQQIAASSIDWQFLKTRQSVESYEIRAKSLAASVLNTTNLLMEELKSAPSVSYTYQTLVSISLLLSNIVALNDYNGIRASVTCSMIDQRMGNIGADNEKLAKVKGNVALAAGLVDAYSATLFSAIYTNYYQLTSERRYRAFSIRNRMNILSASLRQYENLLSASINYINLLYTKWTSTGSSSCSDCGVYGSQASQSLASIDETAENAQKSLIDREALMSQLSIDSTNMMKPLIEDLKNVQVLSDLIINLFSCYHLVVGFRNLTTMDLLNETANCADRTWRLSIIDYKRFQYGVMNNEAQYNLTLLISYASVLNTYYLASVSILTSNQKSTISNIITKLGAISDGFQKYIVDLGLAYSALVTASSQMSTNNAIKECDCRSVATTTLGSTFAPLSTTSSSRTTKASTSTRKVTTSTKRSTTSTPSSSSTSREEQTTLTDTTTTGTTDIETTETTDTEYETTAESTTDYLTTLTDYPITDPTDTTTDYGTYPDTDYTEPVARTRTFANVPEF